MNRFSKIAALLLLIGVSVGVLQAQTSLTQTTLSAAQGIGPASLAGGAQANLQTTIYLASATGVTQAFNGQPVTFAYVDQELEGILTLQTGTTTIFSVLRAQQGTKAAYHASGAMVLIGIMTPQFGGTAGSGGFQLSDPPLGGVCNLASTGLTPWVNIYTGAQWLCTSTLNTPANNGEWSPGFNNPLAKQSPITTAAVASVAGNNYTQRAVLPFDGHRRDHLLDDPRGLQRNRRRVMVPSASSRTELPRRLPRTTSAPPSPSPRTTCTANTGMRRTRNST